MHDVSRRRARVHIGTRLAWVRESPVANTVTSCPCFTNSSVRYETIRSVPPYSLGGTLSYSGATCAIRIKKGPHSLFGAARDTLPPGPPFHKDKDGGWRAPIQCML